MTLLASGLYFRGVKFAARAGVTYHIALSDYEEGRVRLSARRAMAPANDDFVTATPLALGTTVSATTREATVEADDPMGRTQDAASVWFVVAVNAATEVRLDACNGASPSLTVLFGEELGQLTYPQQFFSGCSGEFTSDQPGRYPIEATTFRDDGDFTLSAQAVPPPP